MDIDTKKLDVFKNRINDVGLKEIWDAFNEPPPDIQDEVTYKNDAELGDPQAIEICHHMIEDSVLDKVDQLLWLQHIQNSRRFNESKYSSKVLKQSIHSSFVKADLTQERQSQTVMAAADTEPMAPTTDRLQQFKLKLNAKYRIPSLNQGSARRGSEMGKTLAVAQAVSKFKRSKKPLAEVEEINLEKFYNRSFKAGPLLKSEPITSAVRDKIEKQRKQIQLDFLERQYYEGLKNKSVLESNRNPLVAQNNPNVKKNPAMKKVLEPVFKIDAKTESQRVNPSDLKIVNTGRGSNSSQEDGAKTNEVSRLPKAISRPASQMQPQINGKQQLKVGRLDSSNLVNWLQKQDLRQPANHSQNQVKHLQPYSNYITLSFNGKKLRGPEIKRDNQLQGIAKVRPITRMQQDKNQQHEVETVSSLAIPVSPEAHHRVTCKSIDGMSQFLEQQSRPVTSPAVQFSTIRGLGARKAKNIATLETPSLKQVSIVKKQTQKLDPSQQKKIKEFGTVNNTEAKPMRVLNQSQLHRENHQTRINNSKLDQYQTYERRLCLSTDYTTTMDSNNDQNQSLRGTSRNTMRDYIKNYYTNISNHSPKHLEEIQNKTLHLVHHVDQVRVQTTKNQGSHEPYFKRRIRNIKMQDNEHQKQKIKNLLEN